ncbi:hypothetical protein [Actinoplanes sp. G11-F43]|uniref:hypothetical protein n=1 Tax=Actinoplanes sp. G11-F43 TaxID=3424130 RepID=UPI003D3276CD
MSRQFRYRMAALGLSGLIFGAPLLLNGTASAEQVESNERQVSFGGAGMLGLSCGSRPNVETMTVPAGSVVRVVNQTGHDAQLRLAGAPRGTIPADGSAEVVFRRGATPVLLTPECASKDDTTLPVLVTASPSAAAEEPEPAPAAPGGGSRSVATMSKPAIPGAPARTTAGSTRPGSIAGAARPARTGKESRRGARKQPGSRPATAAQTVTTAAQAMPQGDITSKIKTKPLRSTATGAPVFAGMPPGGRKATVPATPGAGPIAAQAGPARDGVGQGGTVPQISETDEVLSRIPGWEAEPAEPSGLSAAEPVAAVGRIDDGRPLGLLGLTALVCVLGVATAAIRAIVSQRASRTNMA